MSVNELEFVDINKPMFNDESSLKTEINCDDVENTESRNSGDETKCGDIFHSKIGKFIFCCFYCCAKFSEIKEFIGHVEQKHSTLLSSKNNNENHLETVCVEHLPNDEHNGLKPQEISDSEDHLNDKGIGVGPLNDTTSNSIDDKNTYGHLKRRYKCRNCAKYFEVRHKLKEHEKTHVGQRLFDCKHCQKSFRIERWLVSHLRTVHKEVVESSSNVSVKMTETELQSEEIHEAGTQKQILDSTEDEAFENEENLVNFMESNKGLKNLRAIKKEFQCQVCSKSFQRSSTLKQHEKIHSGDRQFVCWHCSMLFSTRSSLSEHIQKVHNDLVENSSKKSTKAQPVQSKKHEFQCEICKDTFCSLSELINHKKIHSSSMKDDMEAIRIDRNVMKIEERPLDEKSKSYVVRKLFQCGVCLKRFQLLRSLKVHERLHIGDQLFTCTHCSTSFSFRKKLDRHVEKVHKTIWNSCQSESVKIEVKEDSEQKEAICRNSSDLILTKFGNHEKLHDRREETESDQEILEDSAEELIVDAIPKLYKCQFCGKTFLKRFNMIIHERNHTGEKPHNCNQCSNAFSSRRLLLKHLRRVHNVIMEASINMETRQKNKLSLNCKYCDISFETIDLRMAHENCHTEARPYQCRFCSNRFKSRQTLNLHIFTHTGERPYHCSECGRSFSQMTNFITHRKRVHLNEKSHKCDFCKKCFVTSSEKTTHMRIHLKEKPFQCEECGKNFTTSSHLTSHKLRHSETKRHVCEVCQKSFYSKAALRDHMPVHTKEKQFQCSVCSLAFSRKNALRSHMKLHSGVKEYICSICQKAFAQHSGLYSHMKSHGITPSLAKVNKND